MAPILKADLLLLLTSVLWGAGFVAQRMGMQHIEPFLFNGIRFLLGAGALLPLIRRKTPPRGRDNGSLLRGGLVAGLVLFFAATMQQVGLVTTTAGKGGFLTSLYVIFVPLLALLGGRHSHLATWTGALLAAAGAYFLCLTGSLAMERGDLLVLVGALGWAVHFLVLDRLTKVMDALRLACLQFVVCGIASFLVGIVTESVSVSAITAALPAIFYGGLVSVGVGYTLQVVAQEHAPPAHAAILLSLESVFAVLAGWIFLGETLTPRAIFGCALILAGVLLTQLRPNS